MSKPARRWIVIRAGSNLPGRPIHPWVLAFVRRLAIAQGGQLTIICGTNHNRYVAGTNPPRQSQHYTGDAADIGPFSGTGPGHIDPRLTRLGRIALIVAGAKPGWARQQLGGFWTIRGVNIGFNTFTGGNHYNHLHVGLLAMPLGLGAGKIPLPLGENVPAHPAPEKPPPVQLPARNRINKPWDHLMSSLDPELKGRATLTRQLGNTIRSRVR